MVIVHDLGRLQVIFVASCFIHESRSQLALEKRGATVDSRGRNARSKGGWNEDRSLGHQRRAEETGSSDEGWVLRYHGGIGRADRVECREQRGKEGGQAGHQSRVEKRGSISNEGYEGRALPNSKNV